MTSANPSFLSEREYLELERRSAVRSAYLDGRIYAMSGASRRHNLIAVNLSREISAQLRGRPCETYVSDMRLKVATTGLYTYPDIVVVCGEPQFEDAHVDTLLNPTLIIEVLSSSTEAYDRGDKFAHYRTLETLREYVLVSQDKIRIEQFRRDGEKWEFSDISIPHGILDLRSIEAHVAVAAIYEKVDVSEPSR